MLLHPLENTGVFTKDWVQKRPRLTQTFGEDFRMSNGQYAYASMGMKGHNGIDFGVPIGTPVFAPCDGKVKVKNDSGGYGRHVKIRSKHGNREIVLGHLDRTSVTDGQMINMGELIGYSGNTGFSTAPHLHIGLRFLLPSNGDIFTWSVQNYDNGYFGYVDFLDKLITFKGSHVSHTILR